jgi:hypothetical protein
VALYLFVVLEVEEVDEGLQEAGLNDRRLVLRMNGHISHTSGGGKDKRKIGGLQQAKKRM